MKKILAVLLVWLVALLPAALGQPVVATKMNNPNSVVPSSGTDLGAQINAAAATCATGSQCQIVVPPGTPTQFATGIIFYSHRRRCKPSADRYHHHGSNNFRCSALFFECCPRV